MRDVYENLTFPVSIEGVQSKGYTQNHGIGQGCPVSLYVFVLVMDRRFEQATSVKNLAVLYRTNQTFTTVTVPGVDVSEIVVAGDTPRFAADKGSTEAALWAIEAMLSEYGLHLNRKKRVALSKGEGDSSRLVTSEEAPIEEKAKT